MSIFANRHLGINIMDLDTLRRLKAGDELAYRKIYDNYYVWLCRFAYQILHDEALAEEAVDDAILHLWEHRREIDEIRSLQAYLIRSVRNRCVDELRLATQRKTVPLSLLTDEENIAFLDYLFRDDTRHPLGLLLEQELQTEIRRCIATLPEECRRVFLKSRVEQKKYEEISVELGISVNTVKYHIKKALSLLHKRFGPYLEILITCLIIP